ncbi:MAG TPA: NF038122 family metalloprotease [Tepidisphaeraceae bacterium]|nr:NF038122 family metalloprotease [Tepidisphaeraceae bacterium]
MSKQQGRREFFGRSRGVNPPVRPIGRASAVESLESRMLLSVSPSLAYGPDVSIVSPQTAAAGSSTAIVKTTQPNHLVINPIFDSTITKDAHAAAIEAALNTMVQNFEKDYTTPITVTVKFEEITSGLASSLTYHTTVSYTSYLKALAAHATSAADKSAVASLPGGTTNPVNKGASILLSDANARALGFSASPPGGLDSTIGLNMSLFNLNRFSISSSKYDLIGSSSHEMDEVLGIDSGLNNYNNGVAVSSSDVAAEDLFRYDTSGHRSYTTSSSAVAAFSFDGGKDLYARFNQTKGGDFNDWYSPGSQVPQVQDAYGKPGSTPNLGTELTVLDVLGYTLASGVKGGFLPDLAPAALSGWSSPLVLTTVKNGITDTPGLTTTSTIYLDAAVQNVGEVATTTSEINTIVLDGKTLFTFSDGSGLSVNNSYYSLGLSLGKLAAGTHTITINADTKNTVNEIIESNNSFTRTFTVTKPLPDLQPYAPTGWSSPLVVGITTSGTKDATKIVAGNTLYVDMAFYNAGSAATPSTAKFSTILKLDGVTVATLVDTAPPLNADYYYYATAVNIGKAKTGKHTLEMIIDSTNLVTESIESNNTYTRTFTVT